jgi:hypothetical protein
MRKTTGKRQEINMVLPFSWYDESLPGLLRLKCLDFGRRLA